MGLGFGLLGATVAVGAFGGISIHFLTDSSVGLVTDNPVEAGSVHVTTYICVWHDVPLGVAHRDAASPPAAFRRGLETT